MERAVEASYYPPEGTRSLGIARASLYGMDAEYKKEANTKKLLCIQIEHEIGVKNIEEIVQVSGLDGVIIGPYDLSGSYGKLGAIQDPQAVEAIDKMLHACKHCHKAVGIFAKHAHGIKDFN